MTNLFQHIEYLLSNHDCVIVPGLGAFIAIVNPAEIDYDKGIILPPSRTVMFNQAVTSDDGLLANSYMRKFNLSFEEARQIIIRQTSHLREKLSVDKKISLGNLGFIQLGEENNLIFTPSRFSDKFNALLGFESVSLKNKIDCSSDKVSSNAISINEANLTESEENEHRIFSIKSFSKIAAAVFVLAAIITTAFIFPIPQDKREQRASVVPVPALKHITIATPSEEIQSAEESKILASQEIESPLPTHYLIVATFSNPQEAQNYVASQSSAENPMQTVASRKVTRVAIASSDNKEQLRKLLNTREILERYPNAWIWSRE